MSDRPTIDASVGLIEQLQGLKFYFEWINELGYQPQQSDWEYYFEHKRRLDPLEQAWRNKRREHMISQARLFLDYVNPIHAKLAKRRPDVAEELFKLLDIYDAACEVYVSLEFYTWAESQPLHAEQAIKKLIKEYCL